MMVQFEVIKDMALRNMDLIHIRTAHKRLGIPEGTWLPQHDCYVVVKPARELLWSSLKPSKTSRIRPSPPSRLTALIDWLIFQQSYNVCSWRSQLTVHSWLRPSGSILAVEMDYKGELNRGPRPWSQDLRMQCSGERLNQQNQACSRLDQSR